MEMILRRYVASVTIMTTKLRAPASSVIIRAPGVGLLSYGIYEHVKKEQATLVKLERFVYDFYIFRLYRVMIYIVGLVNKATKIK